MDKFWWEKVGRMDFWDAMQVIYIMEERYPFGWYVGNSSSMLNLTQILGVLSRVTHLKCSTFSVWDLSFA